MVAFADPEGVAVAAAGVKEPRLVFRERVPADALGAGEGRLPFDLQSEGALDDALVFGPLEGAFDDGVGGLFHPVAYEPLQLLEVFVRSEFGRGELAEAGQEPAPFRRRWIPWKRAT